MTENPWRSIWASSQRRWAYGIFVCALALEAWFFFRFGLLAQLPPAWALVATVVCATLLWPLLRSEFAGPHELAPFFRGALVGGATLFASAFLAHFGYLAFTMATKPHSEFGIILGPISLLMYVLVPEVWLSMIISAAIGGFAFAFSESVG